MSEAVAVPTPVENVRKGTALALLAIPAGVAVWLILWKMGFIASIVGFGDILPEYRNDFLFAAGFGALGAFSMLRAVFQQSNEPTATHDNAE